MTVLRRRSVFLVLAALLVSPLAGAGAAGAQDRQSGRAEDTGPQRDSSATPAARVSASPSFRGVGPLAARYRRMTRDMAAFASLGFQATSTDLLDAVGIMRGYDSRSISSGWIAHHGIQAANHPVFHDAIRRQAEFLGQERFLRWIEDTPSRLRQAPGADAVREMVLDSVNRQTSRMAAMGELLLSRAFDLQAERLDDQSMRSLMFTDNARELVHQYDLKGRYSPRRLPEKNLQTLDRILELGAHLSLGATEGAYARHLETILRDPSLEMCIDEASASFSRCITTASLPEERSYCLGRHGIEELGTCWRWLLEK